MRTCIQKTDYVVLKRKTSRVFLFHYDQADYDENFITCSEFTIVMEKMPTYESLVSALISVKYNTDAQLALLYNYNKDAAAYAEEMSVYQDWRKYCLKAAREFFPVAEVLEYAKRSKLADITEYDASEAVNGFSYHGVTTWIAKADRVGLTNSLSIEKKNGRDVTTIWLNGNAITMPVDVALGMLEQIELYAISCYNTTERHKAAVSALESVSEVEAYDITYGYPNRLEF